MGSCRFAILFIQGFRSCSSYTANYSHCLAYSWMSVTLSRLSTASNAACIWPSRAMHHVGMGQTLCCPKGLGSVLPFHVWMTWLCRHRLEGLQLLRVFKLLPHGLRLSQGAGPASVGCDTYGTGMPSVPSSFILILAVSCRQARRLTGVKREDKGIRCGLEWRPWKLAAWAVILHAVNLFCS